MMQSTHTSSSPPPMIELPFAFVSNTKPSPTQQSSSTLSTSHHNNNTPTTTTTTTATTTTTTTATPNNNKNDNPAITTVPTIPTTSQQRHELDYDFYQDYYTISNPTNHSSSSHLTDDDDTNTPNYITVSEPDTRPIISHPSPPSSPNTTPPDLLSLLLLSPHSHTLSTLSSHLTNAQHAARMADDAGSDDWELAMQYHTAAAREFRNAALCVGEGQGEDLVRSLLLLSQSRARMGMGLKEVLVQRRRREVGKEGGEGGGGRGEGERRRGTEGLREVVRTALETENIKREADITDSTFLGTATRGGEGDGKEVTVERDGEGGSEGNNPVDDMMKLERELKDIDMAPLNASISSLPAHPNRTTDGSFYILPNNTPPSSTTPSSSSSYLSSSICWTHQNTLPVTRPKPPPPSSPQKPPLESSWWGSTLPPTNNTTATPPSDPHQIIRLLGSIKTLTDENATLLREIETANQSRKEAAETRAKMDTFKKDYSQKFTALKRALDKFRKESSSSSSTIPNPVETSRYIKQESDKKEAIIKKLAADLRMEREESKKKDVALRKYEGFYREVKKRSEEKQRQKERLENNKAGTRVKREERIGSGGMGGR